MPHELLLNGYFKITSKMLQQHCVKSVQIRTRKNSIFEQFAGSFASNAKRIVNLFLSLWVLNGSSSAHLTSATSPMITTTSCSTFYCNPTDTHGTTYFTGHQCPQSNFFSVQIHFMKRRGRTITIRPAVLFKKAVLRNLLKLTGK